MLSDDQIDAVTFAQLGDCQWAAYRAHARSIEAEVRGQDEALIRQLVEALTTLRATGAHEGFAHDIATTAITAGRARLEGKP